MNKNIIVCILLTIIPFTSKANSLSDLITIGDRQPIDQPIQSYDSSKNSYPDPFSEDEIILTITNENYLEFSKSILTRGQEEMFVKYPETFRMNIYKSRRSCAVP